MFNHISQEAMIHDQLLLSFCKVHSFALNQKWLIDCAILLNRTCIQERSDFISEFYIYIAF